MADANFDQLHDCHGVAKAAEALIGSPFRLHGRNPATGIDCVGLVCASLDAVGLKSPTIRGYRFRNTSIADWLEQAKESGLARCDLAIRRGDIILASSGPMQQHVLIASNKNTFVHAHAGLRRVVKQRDAIGPQDIIAKWRIVAS